MKYATIKDVANKAGVCAATASKALNGTGSLKPETVKRIKKAAKELGYIPNRFAGALSRRKLKIGVIFPANPIEVMYYIEKGIREGIAENIEYGAEYIIKKYEYYSRDDFLKMLNELAETTDGIIASGIENAEEAEIIAAKPCVLLTSGIKTDKMKLCSKVSVNGFVVGKTAARYISVCGGKNAAIIAGSPNTSLHTENISGFKYEAADCGINVNTIAYCSDKIAVAYEKTLEILNEYPNTDGIFTTSYVAPGICDALKFLKKENDVCVVGLDLYKETKAALADGSLNAVIFQNQVLQAKTAVSTILEMSANKKSGGSYTVRPEIVLKSNLECYEELLTDNYKF